MGAHLCLSVCLLHVPRELRRLQSGHCVGEAASLRRWPPRLSPRCPPVLLSPQGTGTHGQPPLSSRRSGPRVCGGDGLKEEFEEGDTLTPFSVVPFRQHDSSPGHSGLLGWAYFGMFSKARDALLYALCPHPTFTVTHPAPPLGTP